MNIWKKMKKAVENGWDGTITRWVCYCAPGEHLYGEHLFDAAGDGFGDYFYPPEDISFYRNEINKAIRENYCWKDCFGKYKKFGRLDNEKSND